MCCYTKRRLPDATSGGGSGGFLWKMHPDAVCGGNGTGGGTKIDIGGNGNGGVEAWGCEALAGITVAVVVP